MTAVVVAPYLNESPDISTIRGGVRYADFLAPYPAGEIEFQRTPFDHPLFILYFASISGGTDIVAIPARRCIAARFSAGVWAWQFRDRRELREHG